MSPTAVGFVVFACVFGGAVCGILLRKTLPQDHLSAHSKSVVSMCMGRGSSFQEGGLSLTG